MNHVVINTDQTKDKIHRNIYGHFAEHLGRGIYEGIWVGEDSSIPNTNGIRNDVLDALKKINVPVLRWPGGCFADEYHWQDGIGPKEERKKIINTHWGGVVEDNSFGTHEFLMLCEMLETEPYITGNVGSGTVREMAEWVEYITFDGESPMARLRAQNGREKPWKLKYFGIGNENWGCGGHMTPEYYSDLYRQYQTYVRNYGDNQVYKIACGANDSDYRWTEVLMKNAHQFMDGLSLHYYTVPKEWHDKGSATGFPENEWFITLKKALAMDTIIDRHSKIMDQYDPEKRIGLFIDEWGTWYNPEPGTNPGFLYQQNTIRDAVVAGLHFHIFHKHADRVHMANIAQTINVLQAMILTDKERMILTPTYHVFDLFQVHQDTLNLEVFTKVKEYTYDGESLPQISVSASKNDEEHIYISLVNLDHKDRAEIEIELRGCDVQGKEIEGKILSATTRDAHNTFEEPEQVKPASFQDFTIQDSTMTVTLPPMAVAVLSIT